MSAPPARARSGPIPTATGSRRTACRVQYRASLEQDIAAIEEFGPDLAIGTTPVVQHAKQKSIPALYFTNLISARPLMGPAGAGSLAMVVNAALANQHRFDRMTAFFEGVGTGATAGRVGNDARSTAPSSRPSSPPSASPPPRPKSISAHDAHHRS